LYEKCEHASSRRVSAANYLSNVYIQFVSLYKKEFIRSSKEFGERKERKRERIEPVARKQQRCEERFARRHAIRGQMDAESKIALRSNGILSSMPCKRSIARQIIDVVRNGV